MLRRPLALAVAAAALVAAPSAAAADRLSRADVDAMARAMAAPWPGIQRLGGTFPDYSSDAPVEPQSRYGDAFMGWALVELGIRDRDPALADAGVRAIGYAVRRFAAERRDITQSVFENWAVPAAYNAARRALAGDELFRRERPGWERFMRVSRAERSGSTFAYGNHWLVDAAGVLEALRGGLSSPRPDAVLGGRRGAAFLAVLSLVNRRVPALAPAGAGPFLLSDPPDEPLAYEGLSLGMYAYLIRELGDLASARARATLRRAADALWIDTAPDGDSAYFGRSGEMAWGPAGAAYGALVAANLPDTPAADAARYRALAERSLARIRAAYPVSNRGQFYVPGLARDVAATGPWLDGYAGAPSMDAIALVFVELAAGELRPGAFASRLAADAPLSVALGSGRGRIAVARRGRVWFAVRMRPTRHRFHVGDLRYDSGLSIAKARGAGGRSRDVVPLRPTTVVPGFDSAGPNVVSGGRVVAVPVGDRVATSPGTVAISGAIRSAAYHRIAPLWSSYAATPCGVELRFVAYPGHTFEYSAFLRGTRAPRRAGAKLVGAGQAVTARPAPDAVRVEGGYGSAVDPHLVRARLRFRVPRRRTVSVEMC